VVVSRGFWSHASINQFVGDFEGMDDVFDPLLSVSGSVLCDQWAQHSASDSQFSF
jgi:hypothetical protein